ncbi:MAG: flippase-like domain-containing protein [Candidatus Acidulodesulfobacterium acidiphilum]|uniref:Flippase-like domain-containing protein n=1 Tax=Candidatus Acidulodesulfobacterium acidiphilum TaxID=2597224 RepID=A0A520XC80_9DELT|nr:MAG: flippase-like domain-containing protein [Candidatus Acidulodesulfobacterium acidiphilum]
MKLNFFKNYSKKTILKYIFVVTFWFLVLLLILKLINFKINKQIFLNISLSPLIISFCFYILFSIFRGMRIAYLLNSKNYLKSYAISGMYVLSCAIFPGGIGEATLPFYIKKYMDISLSKGTALLLTTRIFDILFVIIFFIYSLFAIHLSYSNFHLVLSGVFFIIPIFFIIFFIIFSNNLRFFFINKLGEKKLNNKNILGHFINKFILYIKNIDNELKEINIKKKDILVLFTLMGRLSVYASFFFLFKSLNLNITINQVIFVSTFVTLMLIIPFQGLGGFGSYEIWVTMALIIVGINKNNALTASIPTQLLFFIFSILEGITGYILLIIVSKRQKNK